MLVRPFYCLLAGLLTVVGACAQAPTMNGAYGVQDILRQGLPRGAVLPQPGSPSETPLQPCAPPVEAGNLTYNAQFENQLLDMINELREKAGVPALTMDEGRLRSAAREKVVERSDSLIGSTLAERLARWCVRYRTADQFAKGMPEGNYPAPYFITQMMDLPTAKALLLNPAYNQIGISVYKGGPDNRYYAALIVTGAP